MLTALERATLVATAAFIMGASCQEPSEGNYDAELAKAAAHLTLRAGDSEPGVLTVWLTGFFAPSDGCPVFDATATANGQTLTLVRRGGLIETSVGVFEEPKKRCTLPAWRLSYALDQPRPDQFVLELADRSMTFRAAVVAPSGAPLLGVSTMSAAAGDIVECTLTPPALNSANALITLIDGSGTRRTATVHAPAEGAISFRVPDGTATGATVIEVVIPNWIVATETECEGPSDCQLVLQESLGRYKERSTASASLEVR